MIAQWISSWDGRIWWSLGQPLSTLSVAVVEEEEWMVSVALAFLVLPSHRRRASGGGSGANTAASCCSYSQWCAVLELRRPLVPAEAGGWLPASSTPSLTVLVEGRPSVAPASRPATSCYSTRRRCHMGGRFLAMTRRPLLLRLAAVGREAVTRSPPQVVASPAVVSWLSSVWGQSLREEGPYCILLPESRVFYVRFLGWVVILLSWRVLLSAVVFQRINASGSFGTRLHLKKKCNYLILLFTACLH